MQVPPMLLDFGQFYPLDRIRLQHSIDQVSDLLADVVGEEIAAFLDFLEQYRHLVIVKRQLSHDHCIQNYPY